MRYACLIYNGGSAAFDGDAAVDLAELRRATRLIAAETLEPADAAVTVRCRHGRVSAVVGPAQAGAAALSGVILIDARDLNDAIRLAATMPAARMGAVEVRPVHQPEGQEK